MKLPKMHIKKGDPVFYSNDPSQPWGGPGEFIDYSKDGEYLVKIDHQNPVIIGWEFALPVIPRIYIPYTIETFPDGPVLVLETNGPFDPPRLVTELRENEVVAIIPRGGEPETNDSGEKFTYKYLLESCIISINNGETWSTGGLDKIKMLREAYE